MLNFSLCVWGLAALQAPITFRDMGDGRGDVWIEPILPLVPPAAPHKE